MTDASPPQQPRRFSHPGDRDWHEEGPACEPLVPHLHHKSWPRIQWAVEPPLPVNPHDDFRDAHERAMRDHILDPKKGWPHRRLDPPLNREGTTRDADGCDDLCSDDIVDRLAASVPLPVNPEPHRILNGYCFTCGECSEPEGSMKKRAASAPLPALDVDDLAAFFHEEYWGAANAPHEPRGDADTTDCAICWASADRLLARLSGTEPEA